jgi:hypothetical protein
MDYLERQEEKRQIAKREISIRRFISGKQYCLQ